MQLKSFILAILLCTATASFAQMGTDSLVFEGRVVNAKGIPLNKATVMAFHSGIAKETGYDGTFCLKLPAQGDSVIISKEGLATFSEQIQYSYKGVVVLSETSAAWLSYGEYIKQMGPIAKVYYDEGLKYLDGDAKDVKKAFACFWRAANMESSPAAYQLGKMYDEGIGVEQNHQTAADWYKNARQTPEAHTRLGIMFEEGIGVKQNYIKAAQHYRYAMDYGDSDIASKRLDQMLEKELVRKEDVPDNRIFEITEHAAQFPGDDQACYAWLAQNIKYPAEAQEQGIQGRVFVSFVVDKDGTITDVEVKRSPDPLLSAEAIRVVNRMPRWKPAMIGNKPVRSRFNLPLSFQLGK